MAKQGVNFRDLKPIREETVDENGEYVSEDEGNTGDEFSLYSNDTVNQADLEAERQALDESYFLKRPVWKGIYRNTMFSLSLVFLAISAVLLAVSQVADVQNFIKGQMGPTIAVHGSIYGIVSFAYFFFNKWLRGFGSFFNYLPLILITINIAALFAIVVALYDLKGCWIAAGMLSLYCCATGFGIWIRNWEIVVLPGVLITAWLNVFLGSAAYKAGVVFLNFSPGIYEYFFSYLVLLIMMFWILYDLELMTTDNPIDGFGIHSIYGYKIPEKPTFGPYLALHVFLDFSNLVLVVPRYIVTVITSGTRAARLPDAFIPRSLVFHEAIDSFEKYFEQEVEVEQDGKEIDTEDDIPKQSTTTGSKALQKDRDPK